LLTANAMRVAARGAMNPGRCVRFCLLALPALPNCWTLGSASCSSSSSVRTERTAPATALRSANISTGEIVVPSAARAPAAGSQRSRSLWMNAWAPRHPSTTSTGCARLVVRSNPQLSAPAPRPRPGSRLGALHRPGSGIRRIRGLLDRGTRPHAGQWSTSTTRWRRQQKLHDNRQASGQRPPVSARQAGQNREPLPRAHSRVRWTRRCSRSKTTAMPLKRCRVRLVSSPALRPVARTIRSISSRRRRVVPVGRVPVVAVIGDARTR